MSKTCINCIPRDNCDFIINQYGYCCYCIKSDSYALIFNLYIHKEFRRLGHAKEIIKMCITAIRKRGYEKEITIEAEPRENSIPVEDLVVFYRKMGLLVIGSNYSKN
ncbi:MAG: GNAT family N-acetyltransferase [Aminipila sp.]